MRESIAPLSFTMSDVIFQPLRAVMLLCVWKECQSQRPGIQLVTFFTAGQTKHLMRVGTYRGTQTNG